VKRIATLAAAAAAAWLVCGWSALPAPPAAATGDEWVIVQYRVDADRAAQLGGPAPSLEEQGFRRVPVPPGLTAAQYVARLRNDPAVASASEDAIVTAAALPNDPFYTLNQARYLANVGAPAAWDISTGNNQVVVAVLDSGIDINHEDLAGRLWVNPGEPAVANGLDSDQNGCIDDRHGCRFIDVTSENAAACGYTNTVPTGDIRDDHGFPGSGEHSHGTLVAGIIGAQGNNGKGITGVAWDVRLMAVKVLDCGPNGTSPRGRMSHVAMGIDYARRMGAQVINLSLSSDPGDPTANTPMLRKAIEDAAAQGIVIVAAAGNHRPGSTSVAPGYPAAYTQYANVVGVGAADLDGRYATFINYGPGVDIAAPGVDIVGTTRTDISPNPYGIASQGTSFSTPLVTGLVALLVARNPLLPANEYVDAITTTATPAEPAAHGGNWAGAGIINMGAAVARIPMTLSGAPLHDWKDVPAGTQVVAFVGSSECGRTTTTTVGPLSRYSLRVRSAVEQPGCGAIGTTVRVRIAGREAQPAFPWAGPNESLGLAGREITSVSPPPGPVVVQQLNGGYANIAQLNDGGPLPGALSGFSGPVAEVLRWDPAKPSLASEGGYRQYGRDLPPYANDLTAVNRYDALWVRAGGSTLATPNPAPAPGRTITLRHGWNNFVYTGTNRQVEDALRSIAGQYTRVMHFDNAAQAWRSYFPGQPRYVNDFGGLFQLKVYWIFVTIPGELRMD
jgi:subtilisin family serine protease